MTMREEAGCYHPRCRQLALYRCHHYKKCAHAGCDEHLPACETSAGTLRLCGACRLLRAIVFHENHLIGLPVQEADGEA